MSASPISYSPVFWRELFGAKENFWVETDLRDGYPEIAMVSAERRSKDQWKFSRDGPSCHPQHPSSPWNPANTLPPHNRGFLFSTQANYGTHR